MLLADESTGNLDSAHKREIMELLTACNRTRGPGDARAIEREVAAIREVAPAVRGNSM